MNQRRPPRNAREGFTEPDLFPKVKKEPKVITTHGRPLSPRASIMLRVIKERATADGVAGLNQLQPPPCI